MQSIKQWRTPSDRAHNQDSISIYWSIDSTRCLAAFQFTRLYITRPHKQVHKAGARAQVHTCTPLLFFFSFPFLSPPHAHGCAHRQDWLAYFTQRWGKCSITEMSRCFKEEICIGVQRQLMKCDLDFFFFPPIFLALEYKKMPGQGKSSKDRES